MVQAVCSFWSWAFSHSCLWTFLLYQGHIRDLLLFICVIYWPLRFQFITNVVWLLPHHWPRISNFLLFFCLLVYVLYTLTYMQSLEHLGPCAISLLCWLRIFITHVVMTRGAHLHNLNGVWLLCACWLVVSCHTPSDTANQRVSCVVRHSQGRVHLVYCANKSLRISILARRPFYQPSWEDILITQHSENCVYFGRGKRICIDFFSCDIITFASSLFWWCLIEILPRLGDL